MYLSRTERTRACSTLKSLWPTEKVMKSVFCALKFEQPFSRIVIEPAASHLMILSQCAATVAKSVNAQSIYCCLCVVASRFNVFCQECGWSHGLMALTKQIDCTLIQLVSHGDALEKWEQFDGFDCRG